MGSVKNTNMRVGYAITACAGGLMAYVAAFAADRSPVADAAMKGDASAVRTLLREKADVNVPQADGATALQWAAYRNDLELADMLIPAGANVKARTAMGSLRCHWPPSTEVLR